MRFRRLLICQKKILKKWVKQKLSFITFQTIVDGDANTLHFQTNLNLRCEIQWCVDHSLSQSAWLWAKSQEHPSLVLENWCWYNMGWMEHYLIGNSYRFIVEFPSVNSIWIWYQEHQGDLRRFTHGLYKVALTLFKTFRHISLYSVCTYAYRSVRIMSYLYELYDICALCCYTLSSFSSTDCIA